MNLDRSQVILTSNSVQEINNALRAKQVKIEAMNHVMAGLAMRIGRLQKRLDEGLPNTSNSSATVVAGGTGSDVPGPAGPKGEKGDPGPAIFDEILALAWLGSRSTTDLPEGTNLYFVNSRVTNLITKAYADALAISHTSLSDKGTNTHVQVDSHISDATLHFTKESIVLAEETISSADTLDDNNDVVLVDCTSGSFSLALHTAATARKKKYTITRIDNSANTVTIDPAGSETINGDATLDLRFQWTSVVIFPDGTNWVRA